MPDQTPEDGSYRKGVQAENKSRTPSPFSAKDRGFINTNPLPLISHPPLPALTYSHVRKSRLPRAQTPRTVHPQIANPARLSFLNASNRFLCPPARRWSPVAHYYAIPLHHVALNCTRLHWIAPDCTELHQFAVIRSDFCSG
jgi:hypothetical protein